MLVKGGYAEAVIRPAAEPRNRRPRASPRPKATKNNRRCRSNSSRRGDGTGHARRSQEPPTRDRDRRGHAHHLAHRGGAAMGGGLHQRALITQTWDYFSTPSPIRSRCRVRRSRPSASSTWITMARRNTGDSPSTRWTRRERVGALAYGNRPGTRPRRTPSRSASPLVMRRAADVPGPVKSACLLMLGELWPGERPRYRRAVASVPVSAEYLLWPYRSLDFDARAKGPA